MSIHDSVDGVILVILEVFIFAITYLIIIHKNGIIDNNNNNIIVIHRIVRESDSVCERERERW